MTSHHSDSTFAKNLAAFQQHAFLAPLPDSGVTLADVPESTTNVGAKRTRSRSVHESAGECANGVRNIAVGKPVHEALDTIESGGHHLLLSADAPQHF